MSFKNRIAFHYMLATAIMMALVFLAIFLIVRYTVYNNLDRDLSFEANKHQAEVRIRKDSIYVAYESEWKEREHQRVQVSPVFIQFTNAQGAIMDKSPNLKSDTLAFVPHKVADHFNATIGNRPLRQVQIPIVRDGITKGYIVTAMSLAPAQIVFRNLGSVLLASYPLLLLSLFASSRYLAGKSIRPIQHISHTTQHITQHNLDQRVQLPTYRDELYDLSANINELLDRISQAMQRERQFTSNASHELRTPLSVLRGTLEVLVRKPRSTADYQKGIKKSLHEIERIEHILQQLLFVARFDQGKPHSFTVASPAAIVEDILIQCQPGIEEKSLIIEEESPSSHLPYIPEHHAKLILGNILSNAFKYSNPKGCVRISWTTSPYLSCTVQDSGIGIAQQDLDNLFTPFFRSSPLNHKEVSGTGLGLSIAKKAADAIDAQIHIDSQLGAGTTVTVTFQGEQG